MAVFHTKGRHARNLVMKARLSEIFVAPQEKRSTSDCLTEFTKNPYRERHLAVLPKRMAPEPIFLCGKNGASRGTRTPDLVLTKDLLYQLSY